MAAAGLRTSWPMARSIRSFASSSARSLVTSSCRVSTRAGRSAAPGIGICRTLTTVPVCSSRTSNGASGSASGSVTTTMSGWSSSTLAGMPASEAAETP